MAQLIFGRYVWVFEMTGALLITAALGAMVLAHRERLGKGPNQREWSRRRFENLAGLPAPGVYARHNAVDTPALLPDAAVPRSCPSRGRSPPASRTSRPRCTSRPSRRSSGT